jgi:hypothetical protein
MLAHASFVVRTVVKAFYSIFYRIGIEGWFTEHRIAESASTQARPQADVVDVVSGGINLKDAQEPASATAGIGLATKLFWFLRTTKNDFQCAYPKAAMISKMEMMTGGFCADSEFCEFQSARAAVRHSIGRCLKLLIFQCQSAVEFGGSHYVQ